MMEYLRQQLHWNCTNFNLQFCFLSQIVDTLFCMAAYVSPLFSKPLRFLPLFLDCNLTWRPGFNKIFCLCWNLWLSATYRLTAMLLINVYDNLPFRLLSHLHIQNRQTVTVKCSYLNMFIIALCRAYCVHY